MKKIRQGLVFVMIVYFFLAVLIACATPHTIVFQDEACIKPFKHYIYHTCEAMHVLIDGGQYVVPKDFKTNLASIPRPLWSIFAPQYTAFVAPAILHDYLYTCGNLGSREWSDEVLYSSLVESGVTRLTAMKFFVVVRLFGASHYEEHENTCFKQDKIWMP